MAFKSDAHRRWWFANRGNAGGGAGGAGASGPSFSSRDLSAGAAQRQREKDQYFAQVMREENSAAHRQAEKDAYFQSVMDTGGAPGEGLVRYDGEWMTPEAAQRQREQDEYFAQVMRDEGL